MKHNQAYQSKTKVYVLEEEDRGTEEEVQRYCAEEGTTNPSDKLNIVEESTFSYNYNFLMVPNKDP
jgi:hypothetical protein